MAELRGGRDAHLIIVEAALVFEGFPDVLQLDFVITRSGLSVEVAEELADNVVLANVLFGGEYGAFWNREVEPVLVEALDYLSKKASAVCFVFELFREERVDEPFVCIGGRRAGALV